MTNLLRVLPLAIVMIAGPQVLSAILLATSERAKRDSAAFVTGAVAATAAGVTVAYVVARALHERVAPAAAPRGVPLADWIILALLVALMVRVFVKRATSEPPAWMSKVQAMSPRWAFRLGVLLFIAMPTDIMMMITVGTFLASHGDPLWHATGFVALTGLLVAGPLLALLVLGKRANEILPKVRDWMRAKSWVVSELVLLLFLVLVASDILKRL